MTDTSDVNWYSNDAATFGDRIAAAREGQGLSQKDLAKKLGVATKTLDGWENDLSEPRANRLQMLAGLLNVSMPWLLTGEGDGPDGPSDSGEPLELREVMAEMRMLRTQMSQAADRIGVLEKRLRTAVADSAA
ncbi:helix-turn-helix domain-containing protein [Alphaproteobacteria bacterium GH1-50]|uniref:Helix-turn-helix domain-containing protein n=1 Tax=Kangsaoukella pontilimi TaxID=2691042 RepID=A0A7C9IRI5_9RHOB|nr:helix-turn-helix domain-containing protein [Kangsaoukella pontilimi]MXQ08783.1 helix-turn-helix domain-containing protein [Kangsaoukella pontilimi]